MSATGKLMRNLFKNHALELWVGGDTFQVPFQQLQKCITETWFKSTLAFITELDIDVESPIAHLQTWKSNDTFLMEDTIRTGMSSKELAAVNRCHMHIQVT